MSLDCMSYVSYAYVDVFSFFFSLLGPAFSIYLLSYKSSHPKKEKATVCSLKSNAKFPEQELIGSVWVM